MSAKAEKLLEEIAAIPDEVYEDKFGDHCRVIATKNGFDVEELEHD